MRHRREFEKQHAETRAQRGEGYKAWYQKDPRDPRDGDGDPVEAPALADLSPPTLTAELKGLIDQRDREVVEADKLRKEIAPAKDKSEQRPVRARSAAHFSD